MSIHIENSVGIRYRFPLDDIQYLWRSIADPKYTSQGNANTVLGLGLAGWFVYNTISQSWDPAKLLDTDEATVDEITMLERAQVNWRNHWVNPESKLQMESYQVQPRMHIPQPTPEPKAPTPAHYGDY